MEWYLKCIKEGGLVLTNKELTPMKVRRYIDSMK